ncbi:MAG: hypothetical protein K2W95_32975 [Candidatus Obscuribacterales bacterium]|nr:hypothetical protein [Candidatus Obscuribacterales bacterium]
MKNKIGIFGFLAAGALALFAVPFPGMAHAADAPKPVASVAADNVDITIYGQRYAQVQETRTVTLTAGANKVQLNGIAGQYRNDSLRVITASGAGTFTYKSATYQPANLTPERILAESVGKEIEVFQKTGAGEWVKGKLLTSNGGQVTLQLASGEVRVITSSDVRVSQTPAGLSNTAALVVECNVSVAGDYKITFAYDTNGLGWSAKHTLVYDDSNSKVESWKTTVNIVNNSGVTYGKATVRLISGAVVDKSSGVRMRGMPQMAPASADFGQSESASVESVGDQKTYNLPETLELVSGQARQVVLFEGRNIDVTRTYFVPAFSGGDESKQQSVSIRLSVDNSEKNNMGKALPAGPVQVYQYNQAGIQLVTGGDNIGDKAAAEKFDMVIGTASDIKYTRTQTSSKRYNAAGDELNGGTVAPVRPAPPIGRGPRPSPTNLGTPAQPNAVADEPVRQEDTYEVKVYNYKDNKKVTVKVEVYLPQDQTVVKPLVKKNANQAEATVTVNASGNSTVEYTITTNLK